MRPILPPCQPITFKIRLVKHYRIAGMSKDCKYTFFHDEKRVTVLETSQLLESILDHAVQMPQSTYSYDEGRRKAVIERVALSGQWLAICTNQELKILQIRIQPSRALEMLRSSHGEWEPTGLAICEHNAKLLCVIGQRKHKDASFQGRVLLFHIRQSINSGSSMPEPNKYDLPQNDFPKEVDINFDGTLILCRTELHNSVIIWELDSRPGSDQRSLKITRHPHTPVSIILFFRLFETTYPSTKLSLSRRLGLLELLQCLFLRRAMDVSTCSVQRMPRQNDGATEANGHSARLFPSHLNQRPREPSTIWSASKIKDVWWQEQYHRKPMFLLSWKSAAKFH